MKEETRYARQLFLYGEGTTKPIRGIQALSKKSGVPARTLRDHVKAWRSEAENLALTSENSPYTLALSTEMLTQHKNEITFLGNQVLKLRKRLRELDTGSANYIVTLSAYQSALTKWEKSSGILAHYDAASAALKEQAKATAKARAQRDGDPDGSQGLRRVNKDRFDHEG